MAREKMICQECNMELNHHAEKLVEPVTREQAAKVDAAFGALVEEMHSCPGCGITETRLA